MIVPPDNNLTAIMKKRLYNETSGLGETFINQINNDTYNDFWRVAVAVPNWNRDACNYYNIFNAQIKPCIAQAALLSAAEYPKPLKNKDFAWANAIVICLDILGAVLVAVLAMAVMMRCRSKRAGASNEMRSVRGADMGPGDRDHSQMDLNGPSQNDVSADVGFNTGAQGSALISNKSTPGANVSVEPAT